MNPRVIITLGVGQYIFYSIGLITGDFPDVRSGYWCFVFGLSIMIAGLSIISLYTNKEVRE